MISNICPAIATIPNQDKHCRRLELCLPKEEEDEAKEDEAKADSKHEEEAKKDVTKADSKSEVYR